MGARGSQWEQAQVALCSARWSSRCGLSSIIGEIMRRVNVHLATAPRRPMEPETLKVGPAVCVLTSPQVILTHTEWMMSKLLPEGETKVKQVRSRQTGWMQAEQGINACRPQKTRHVVRTA